MAIDIGACINCEEPIYSRTDFVEPRLGKVICGACVRNGGTRAKGTGWRAIDEARLLRKAMAGNG